MAEAGRRIRQSAAWRARGVAIAGANVRQSVAGTPGLRVIDNYFPHVFSGFRLAEFNAYLAALPHAEVHSTLEQGLIDGVHLRFSQCKRAYAARYPDLARRVKRYDERRLLYASGLYCVFLGNALEVSKVAERCDAGFAFTLYPGGGFRLNEPASDDLLKQVLTSKSFRRVLVTQPVTLDYVLSTGLCSPNQIEYAYGAVVPYGTASDLESDRPRFAFEKATLDICFAAARNLPGGADKGYDVFADVAQRLTALCAQARFHVVGPWGQDDADLGLARERVTFYGCLDSSRLAALFSKMDVLLSPNAPFILSSGSFDGFPTATAVEAGLRGAVVACTDLLDQNRHFVDGYDIVLIPHKAEAIAERLAEYAAAPERLRDIGERGRTAFRRLFGIDCQMEPRMRIVSALAGEE